MILALARPGLDVPYTHASQLAAIARHGSNYSGHFPNPVSARDVLRVDESLRGFINGILVSYYSINERVAGACTKLAPPTGTVRIVHHKHLLREFLRHGLAAVVTDDEAGTVTENLYLDNGARLPAMATRARGAKRPRPTLIGRAKVTVGKPGGLSVIVRPTAAGKRLKGQRRPVKSLLVTTLRNSVGGLRTLAAKHVTLKP